MIDKKRKTPYLHTYDLGTLDRRVGKGNNNLLLGFDLDVTRGFEIDSTICSAAAFYTWMNIS